MNAAGIALDTTIAIRVGNHDSDVIAWLRGFPQVFLPVVALAELRFGAENSGRPDENLATVEEIAARCPILIADEAVAREWASLKAHLRRTSTPIPDNDLWIAAICRVNDLPVATFDRHFASVPNLVALAPMTS